jgi:hypothetical protein
MNGPRKEKNLIAGFSFFLLLCRKNDHENFTLAHSARLGRPGRLRLA